MKFLSHKVTTNAFIYLQLRLTYNTPCDTVSYTML